MANFMIARVTVLMCVAGSSISCAPFFHASQGTNAYVNTSVSFISPDGQPIVGEVAYVLESMGSAMYITEVVKTDNHGSVIIDGFYCVPMIVAVDGGGISLREKDKQRHYVVIDGRYPLLEKGYGIPDADHIKEHAERINDQYCG